MVEVTLTALAAGDIQTALAVSLERWGENQMLRYAEVIDLALEALAENPALGRARPEIRLGIRAHPIRRPGRNARHIIFYRIEDDGSVRVLRILHDAMSFARLLAES